MLSRSLQLAAKRLVATPMKMANGSMVRSVGLKSLTMGWKAQSAARFYSGRSDPELSSILTKEIRYEKEQYEAENLATPEFLVDFNAKKLFTISDQPGNNEVTLTRDFGAEKIQITFSIDDVVNAQPDESSDEITFPISTVITITKPSFPEVGALTFQTIMENGNLQITNVTHTADGQLAVTDTAEADYQRRGQYLGPIFEDLDETLSQAWYTYLEERGVDEYLADFVGAYVDWKEQKEYMRWLSLAKNFVDRT